MEIREPGTEAIIVAVLMEAIPERLILVSFHPESVAMAKRLLSGVPAGLISSGEIADPIGLARSVQADLLLPRWDRASRELVERVHAAGLLIVSWVLNTEDDLGEALRLGIGGFSSDDPCAARRYLERQIR